MSSSIPMDVLNPETSEETLGSGPPVVVTSTLIRNEEKDENDVATTAAPSRQRFWFAVGIFVIGLIGCGLISLGFGLYCAGVVHFILRDLNHEINGVDEIFTQNIEASLFAAKVCLLWEMLALCSTTFVIVVIIRSVFLLPAVAKFQYVEVMRSLVIVLLGVIVCCLQSLLYNIRSSIVADVVNNFPLCE